MSSTTPIGNPAQQAAEEAELAVLIKGRVRELMADGCTEAEATAAVEKTLAEHIARIQAAREIFERDPEAALKEIIETMGQYGLVEADLVTVKLVKIAAAMRFKLAAEHDLVDAYLDPPEPDDASAETPIARLLS